MPTSPRRAPRRASAPQSAPRPTSGSTPATRDATSSSTSSSAASSTPASSRPPRRRRSNAQDRPTTSAPAAVPTRDSTPATTAPAVVTPAVVTEPDGRTFAELGVPAPLVRVLTEQGIHAPFAIQAATVEHGLAGHDVLGRARTGSGKTLAFTLPLVARLAASGTRRRPGKPRSLVLAPTRELAAQIAAVVAPLAAASGLTHTTIYGGVGQNPQVSALRAGVDIVIACPGRLEDLLRQGHADLGSVETTVLDEADHMADLGFLPVVRRLLDLTPSNGQRLLFSATLDGDIDVLVRRYMHDAKRVSVDAAAAAPVEMDHHVLEVDAAEKLGIVRALASGQDRTLLFTRTKHQAKKLAKQLTAAGTPAVDLHGNLSQNARERNLAAFTDGSARVLVATDIAARGIHVDDVNLVVHVDPPADHKAYLHRSGRTARAGAKGTVVTIATDDQRGDVNGLVKAAAIRPTRTRVNSAHPLLRELTGPAAAFVAPAEPAPVAARSPKSTSGTTGAARGRGPRTTQASAPGQARSGSGRGGGRGGSARGGAPKARTSSGGLAWSSSTPAPRTGGARSGGRRPA